MEQMVIDRRKPRFREAEASHAQEPSTQNPEPRTQNTTQHSSLITQDSTALGDLLRARGLTLAVAESCTGGGLADAITDIPGSSDYFLGGVVSYSNSAKERLLGVARETLTAHGAVSEPVARQMAEGVRSLFRSDLAAGITGIVGPGGGSAEKPVGVVYIAVASPRGTEVRRYLWDRDRTGNKALSVNAALEMLIAAASQ
jgi:PncC family amidohydrolase